MPPSGRSLLDQALFYPSGALEIPYPFTALLERIGQQLGAPLYDLEPIKQILIPAGRSLQRSAAAPEYFRYPRVVIAVDSEPKKVGLIGGLPMKDMLFLGYQERARVIEAISYNPDAARFEFQIIKNYGPDTKPDLVYADRGLCMSCHQNAGPIFSEAPLGRNQCQLPDQNSPRRGGRHVLWASFVAHGFHRRAGRCGDRPGRISAGVSALVA